MRLLLAAALLLSLASCSSVDVTDYAGRDPVFEPEVFFEGPLTAHGVIKDRSGKVTRHFTADIDASWEAGIGTLAETFLFNDGETQLRTWTLRPAGENRYIGTAGDVVGDGMMEVAGNSMFLDYTLRVPWGDGTIDLRVDDRMYLVDENVLVNESRLSKFGINVGSILLVILRESSVDQQ